MAVPSRLFISGRMKKELTFEEKLQSFLNKRFKESIDMLSALCNRRDCYFIQ
jgi:hypothetical protein